MVIKRLGLVLAVLIAGYLAIDYLTPNPDMILAQRVLQTAACAMVVYVYWPDFLQACVKLEAEKGDYIIMGVVMSYAAVAMQSAWAVVFRLGGTPQWMINADVTGLFILLSTASCFLHVVRPNAIDGRVPRRSRIAGGVAVAFATTFVLGVVATRPDISGFVNWFQPYLQDWFSDNLISDKLNPHA